MDPNQRNKLEMLRAQLQRKLKVESEIKNTIDYWLETYDYILANNLAHRLCSLSQVDEQDLSIWLEFLNSNYGNYHFTTDDLKQDNWLEFYKKIDKLFPNSHFLRYVPAIPKVCDALANPQDGIKKSIDSLGLKDQKVLLYYQNYSPILELNLYDLRNHAEQFFYLGHDEAIIVPENLQWMIFYSIEEEWFAGYKSM